MVPFSSVVTVWVRAAAPPGMSNQRGSWSQPRLPARSRKRQRVTPTPVPGVQLRAAVPLPAVAVSVGAEGSAWGVATASSEAAPLPVAFTARTRKRYSVAFVSWLTVWVVVAAALDGTAVHEPHAFVPAFCRNSQREMVALPGSSQVRTTAAAPAFAPRPVGFAGIRVAEASLDTGPAAPVRTGRTWKV